MKDRQRWQPEEDALLCAYVKQYGPHDWHLVSERLGKSLDRDPKSCLERWKNYLKPGIKRGPLTEDEQLLIIRLQAKYGNKWKRIAAEVPGRTAKRLGKWWEVYKERKLKEKRQHMFSHGAVSDIHPDKFVPEQLHLPSLIPVNGPAFSASSASEGGSELNLSGGICKAPGGSLSSGHEMEPGSNMSSDDEPVLTLGPKQVTTEFLSTSGTTSIPTWMSNKPQFSVENVSSTLKYSCETRPAVHLSLSPGRGEGFSFGLSGEKDSTCLKNTLDDAILKIPGYPKDAESSNEDPLITRKDPSTEELMPLLGLFKELEGNREKWIMQKRNIGLRLKDLKQQLESERVEKRKQKMEEIEAKVQALRKEEKLYLDKLELDYTQLALDLDRDAELKEAKLLEGWTSKYGKLVHLFENTMHQYSSLHGPVFQAIHLRGINNPI